MNNEALNYNNVTLEHDLIKNCSFRVFKKEIYGLIFINKQGKTELIDSLLNKLDLEFGNIFVDEELYISYSRNITNKNNFITYISNKSTLISSISLADNIFLFKKNAQFFIRETLLVSQLSNLIKEFKLNISLNTYSNDLSIGNKVIIELLRAYVSNSKIIILDELSSFVPKGELKAIKTFIRHLVNLGISFIYIENHHEEIIKDCKRIGLMKNGTILKEIVNDKKINDVMNVISSSFFKVSNSLNLEKHTNKIVLSLPDFNLNIREKECISIIDYDNSITDKMINKIKNNNKISIINENPLESMLFFDLPYMDNLCFLLGNRINRFFFSQKYKKSVYNEYREIIGYKYTLPDLYSLNTKELYELVYYRIIIQKPNIVFCIKPFSSSDMYQRMRILKLLEKIKANNIAIVIINVNLSDSLQISDKLIIYKNNRIEKEFLSKDFNFLKEST